MTDQVAEVKAKVDLAQLIGERVPLKLRGRRFLALCPFHSEKTPSFTVSPELGIFKCFGCGISGDVFTFLERYEGMTFPEALEYAAERVGVKLERRVIDARVASTDKAILEVNHLAAEYYHFLLTKHSVGEKARKYVKNRHIRSDAITHYTLGYALARWDGLLTFLTKKGYAPELLEQAGLVIKKIPNTEYRILNEKQKNQRSSIQNSDFRIQNSSYYYDRFRGRVMFPLLDPRGQVIGFSGRVLQPDAKDPPSLKASEGQAPKYINSPETPVYHKGRHLFGIFENREDIRRADRVVLVEGELDAISSWQTGVRNVLAAKGTALTDDQVKLIRRYTRNVTVALDADEAGWEAFLHGLPVFESAGMNVRVVVLPTSVKDPDDLATSNPSEWRTFVSAAQNVYDAVITGMIKRTGSTSGEEKKSASERLVPILSGIKNPVEQDHWIGTVAHLLGVREEAVRRQTETFVRVGKMPDSTTTRDNASKKQRRSRAETLSRYLLSILIQSHHKYPSLLDLMWIEPVGVRTILKSLPPVANRRSQADLRGLREGLAEELRHIFDESILSPVSYDDDGSPNSSHSLEQEMAETVRLLEIEWLRRQIREHHADPQAISSLTRRLTELSKTD